MSKLQVPVEESKRISRLPGYYQWLLVTFIIIIIVIITIIIIIIVIIVIIIHFYC